MLLFLSPSIFLLSFFGVRFYPTHRIKFKVSGSREFARTADGNFHRHSGRHLISHKPESACMYEFVGDLHRITITGCFARTGVGPDQNKSKAPPSPPLVSPLF